VYEIEIADAVQAWANDPASNLGLALVGSGQAAVRCRWPAQNTATPRCARRCSSPISARRHSDIDAAEGDGLLVAQVLLEGRDDSPTAP
jgi:hypothetical protein